MVTPDAGWIKIHRAVKSHWLYEVKPFDKYHAWEDLLLSASHKQTKFLHGNKLTEIQPGQFITSLRKLSEKWGWGKSTVDRFLTLLESDGMIKIFGDTTRTLITVENWSFYQSQDEKAGHGADTEGTRADTIKNDKNDKKDIEEEEEARARIPRSVALEEPRTVH